jgi:hypothetical protein
MNPKEWGEMVDFVAKQYDTVLDEIRKTEFARRELVKQLLAARKELEQIRAKGDSSPRPSCRPARLNAGPSDSP